MKKLHKIGKFYTKIIMKNIGIFIFIGLLSVVCNVYGWFPNEDMYAISQFIYKSILPALIAYEGGRAVCEKGGGTLAVLILSGILLCDSSVGILGAMITGPLAGWLWKYEESFLKERMNSSMQMLVRNLALGATGSVMAALGFYVLSPMLGIFTGVIYRGVNFMLSHGMIAALSILIEPAKVFFLNNIMNHAVLVPLGIGQVQEAGQSVLFLLESNPGPGLGVMAALYCAGKDKRSEYMSMMFAEALGGIHEVYFPLVLSNLSLMIPLILGGIAGNICFGILHAGVQGAVSPGSILVILLMAGKGRVLPVFAGILVSALVSFGGSILLLNKKKKREETMREEDKRERMEEKNVSEAKKKIEAVAFVCDGGVGSSAMGAALFRRTLARAQVTDVRVEVYAADMVPDNIDLIVCQRDFYRLHPEGFKNTEVCTVESLVKTEEFQELIEQIQKRNR